MTDTTGKWFWCPKCNKIAPQLTRGRLTRIKSNSSNGPDDHDRIIRKIGFTLANPIVDTKTSLAVIYKQQ